MICKNIKCGKEIEEPLILIDGSWYCPFCKDPLVNEEIPFKITKESNDLFKLSELFYYKSFKEKDSEKREFYIANAVANCRLAVEQGHPGAYIKLGFYYDKDYIELNRSEISRTQMAYQYYSAVCFSVFKETDFTADNGVEHKSFAEYKKEAALLMLRMLSEFADGELLHKRYNYNENVRLVKEKVGIIDLEIERSNYSFLNQQKKDEKIYATLCDTKNKKRAPLFGIFNEVSIKDLKEILNKDNEYVLNTLIKKEDLLIYIYDSVENGGTKELLPLANKKVIDSTLETLEDNKVETTTLFFFNKKNGHNFLKKKEVSKVKKCLIDGTYLSSLIKNLQSRKVLSRVYYDDDIYCKLDSKTTPEDAINCLE